MKRTYTYYKGFLRCQFRTINKSKLGISGYQSEIILEPRFRLFDAVEIQESDMPRKDSLSGKAYVFQTSQSFIEIYSQKDPEGLRRTTESICLFLENNNTHSDKHAPFEDYLGSIDTDNVYKRSFAAFKPRDNHGKMSGTAYVTLFQELDEQGNIITNAINNTSVGGIGASGIDLSQRRGCLPSRSSGVSLLSQRKGCGSALGFFTPLLSNLGISGINRQGGCLPILKLLGGLALLLGLLSMLFRTCNSNQEQAVITPPIHDTIYKEVIKTVTDTLTIIKSDTVSFVDSTTKTTYEMVSLPNVQFYTNSHVLLPASAKDLQKLAEYLIKNANLTATIYGHTDNVGNPEVNLKLSQARAESVKQFLVNLGVASERLVAVGMGDTRPKGDNAKEEGRMLNRRVEVKLMEAEKIEVKRTQTDNSNKNAKK